MYFTSAYKINNNAFACTPLHITLYLIPLSLVWPPGCACGLLSWGVAFQTSSVFLLKMAKWAWHWHLIPIFWFFCRPTKSIHAKSKQSWGAKKFPLEDQQWTGKELGPYRGVQSGAARSAGAGAVMEESGYWSTTAWELPYFFYTGGHEYLTLNRERAG